MARPLRVEFEGAWYHVMNRGANRRPVFLSPIHRRFFLKLLQDISEIFLVEIHAFCLMTDHYHLLVRTPVAGLSRAMRHLDGVYTQRFNRQTDSDGPLFRGRFKSIIVGSDVYQLQVSRYIHLNPVQAGIVEQPENYRYSSYGAYVGIRPAPAWLHTSATLHRFGSDKPMRRYRQFVETGIDKETEGFYDRVRLEPVFGDTEFKEEIRRQARMLRRNEDREISDARRLEPRPRLSTIVEAVCTFFNIEPGRLKSRTKAGRHELSARSVAVYLGRYDGGCQLAEVALVLGYRSYSGAAMALTRLRARLDEPRVRHTLQEIRALMYKVKT